MTHRIEIDRDQKGDAFDHRGEALYNSAVADEIRLLLPAGLEKGEVLSAVEQILKEMG